MGEEFMPKRKCAACGKEKEVRGGKVCSNGHLYAHRVSEVDFLEGAQHARYVGSL
jgi:hypothetical protein